MSLSLSKSSNMPFSTIARIGSINRKVELRIIEEKKQLNENEERRRSGAKKNSVLSNEDEEHEQRQTIKWR